MFFRVQRHRQRRLRDLHSAKVASQQQQPQRQIGEKCFSNCKGIYLTGPFLTRDFMFEMRTIENRNVFRLCFFQGENWVIRPIKSYLCEANSDIVFLYHRCKDKST